MNSVKFKGGDVVQKFKFLALFCLFILVIVFSTVPSHAGDGTHKFRLTLHSWHSWSPPYSEVHTYIYQIRQGDQIVVPGISGSSGGPLVRLVDFPERNVARFSVEQALELIGKDHIRRESVDTVLVSYDDVCLGTPSLDAGVNYCLRIDSMYDFSEPYDTIPRYMEVDEDPMTWTFERASAYESGKVREEWSEAFNEEMRLVRHGEYRVFAQNGEIIQKMNYDHGIPDGPYYEWFSDGQIKLKGTYVDGLKDGEWQHWDTLGRDVGLGKYDMGTGVVKIFYPDGKPRNIDHYKDGRLHGSSELYYMNGNIHFRKEYTDGQPSGTWKFYDPDGELYFETKWPGGTKYPPKYWYKTGIMRYDHTGDKNRRWYVNGQLEYEVPVDEDRRRHGHFTSWYPNGQKESEGEIVHGRRTGLWNFWEKDGQLREDVDYGKADGTDYRPDQKRPGN